MHPKQKQALEEAKKRHEHREYMKAQVASARANGIRFANPSENLTVAFMADRRDIFYISTALRHPHDKSDPITGRFIAASLLESGSCIRLRKPSDLAPKRWLEMIFS